MTRAIEFIAFLAVALAISSVDAALVGPTPTTPAGGSEAWSGHPGFGAGLGITGSGYDLSQVDKLYWGIRGDAIAFGMDGFLHSMTFNSGLSNLANGYARLDGSTPTVLVNYFGTDPTILLRTDVFVTAAGTSTPLALTDSSTIAGLTGSAGFVLDVSGAFDVVMMTYAYWPGGYNQTASTGWRPYGEVYHDLETPANWNGLTVNVGSTQWYEPKSVPEPTTLAIWSALGSLGMMIAARRRRKAA